MAASSPTAPLVSYNFLGLRDLIGRFASMTDRNLMEITQQGADELAAEVQDLYRAAAPKSRQDPQPPRTKTFSESITSEVNQVPWGFVVRVQTEQPDVRDYIRFGHRALGPDDLKTAKAFHFFVDGDEVFATRISAVAPNDWEARTEADVWPAIQVEGNRMCVRVTQALGSDIATTSRSLASFL